MPALIMQAVCMQPCVHPHQTLCLLLRPVSSQEWEDTLQDDGAISGFQDIVEQILQRVRYQTLILPPHKHMLNH